MDQYGFEDKFSDDEIKVFKEAFMFFDRNGNGTMKNEGYFTIIGGIEIIMI